MPAYDCPGGLIAMVVLLEVAAAGAVLLRFLARRKLKNGYGIEAWLILAALVPATGLAVLEIWAICVKALGTPLAMSPPNSDEYQSRVTLAGYVEFSFMTIATPTLGLIKLSLVFLYRRLFVKPWFMITCNVWIFILLLFTVGFTVAALAQCGDHLKIALSSNGLQQIYCTSTEPVGLAYLLGDPITDFFIMILPLPIIFNLRLPLHRKLLVALIFLCAFFSLFCSCARAWVYLSTNQYQDLITMYTELSVWNYLEVQIGVMVACAPLLKSMMPKSLSVQKTRVAMTRLLHATQSFVTTKISDRLSAARHSRSRGSGSSAATRALVDAQMMTHDDSDSRCWTGVSGRHSSSTMGNHADAFA